MGVGSWDEKGRGSVLSLQRISVLTVPSIPRWSTSWHHLHSVQSCAMSSFPFVFLESAALSLQRVVRPFVKIDKSRLEPKIYYFRISD